MPNGARPMKIFLTIWIGQVVSTLGSALTNFGISLWVLKHTHSTTAFAVSMIFATLPGILLSPLAGILADKWDRRIAMMVSDSGAGLSSLILVLLAGTGHLELWGVYVLMGLSSAFGTLSWPAFTAVTSILVPKEQLGRASGLVQSGEAASMILAPALGAFLLVFGGLQLLVLLDVCSFAIALTTLAIVRVPKPPHTTEEGPKPSLWKQLSFGWRYIKERPGLLGLLVFFLLVNFTTGFANVLFGPLAVSLYDEKFYGLIGSTFGVAMLIGTIIMGVWGGPKKKVYGVLGFSYAMAASQMMMVLAPSRVLFLATAFLMMLVAPIMNGCSQAIWQAKVALDIQGRVFAVRRMIAWFTSPIAFAVAGPLADRVFEPGMRAHGALSPALGPLFGTGAGAGIRVMMVSAGVALAIVASISLLHPRIRNVEMELADAVREEPTLVMAK